MARVFVPDIPHHRFYSTISIFSIFLFIYLVLTSRAYLEFQISNEHKGTTTKTIRGFLAEARSWERKSYAGRKERQYIEIQPQCCNQHLERPKSRWVFLNGIHKFVFQVFSKNLNSRLFLVSPFLQVTWNYSLELQHENPVLFLGVSIQWAIVGCEWNQSSSPALVQALCLFYFYY